MAEYNFSVRWYQQPFHKAFATLSKKRLIEIAHRRWGKDEICLNVTRKHAFDRPGSYWHCLPEYAQGRKAIWTAVNAQTGKKRIDEAFPDEIRERVNNQEMFIEFKNGSTWQVIGSDRYDSTVGAGTAGIVYSEWALANPSAWGYHRPMVEENNGWAAFITTPRGNNHAKRMYDMAAGNPNWFAEISTAEDTGALTTEALAESLLEYQSLYGIDFGLAHFEQEYLCSFAGAMVGAYFGAEMSKAEREGRITDVPIDEKYPVNTVWDLGKAVNNPIWCFQVINGELRIVDFYQPESEDLDDWCRELDARGYHGHDYVPHDILRTEWGQSKTRIERLRENKRKPKRIPMVSVADGQQAGRMAINAARFDAVKCETGIDGLKNYRREWDDGMKTFRENPVKDWSEHTGSAWRYLGLCWRDEVTTVKKPDKKPIEYTASPSGLLTSNVSIDEAIKDMIARKRRKGL